jgi:copper chaperone CopZ
MISPRRLLSLLTLLLMLSSMSLVTAAEDATTAIYVSNMHCEGCAKKLRQKLFTVKGVAKVTTSVKEGVARITSSTQQEVSLRALWEAAEAMKFKPTKVIGPQGEFTSKPEVSPEFQLPASP